MTGEQMQVVRGAGKATSGKKMEVWRFPGQATSGEKMKVARRAGKATRGKNWAIVRGIGNAAHCKVTTGGSRFSWADHSERDCERCSLQGPNRGSRCLLAAHSARDWERCSLQGDRRRTRSSLADDSTATESGSMAARDEDKLGWSPVKRWEKNEMLNLVIDRAMGKDWERTEKIVGRGILDLETSLKEVREAMIRHNARDDKVLIIQAVEEVESATELSGTATTREKLLYLHGVEEEWTRLNETRGGASYLRYGHVLLILRKNLFLTRCKLLKLLGLLAEEDEIHLGALARRQYGWGSRSQQKTIATVAVATALFRESSSVFVEGGEGIASEKNKSAEVEPRFAEFCLHRHFAAQMEKFEILSLARVTYEDLFVFQRVLQGPPLAHLQHIVGFEWGSASGMAALHHYAGRCCSINKWLETKWLETWSHVSAPRGMFVPGLGKFDIGTAFEKAATQCDTPCVCRVVAEGYFPGVYGLVDVVRSVLQTPIRCEKCETGIKYQDCPWPVGERLPQYIVKFYNGHFKPSAPGYQQNFNRQDELRKLARHCQAIEAGESDKVKRWGIMENYAEASAAECERFLQECWNFPPPRLFNKIAKIRKSCGKVVERKFRNLDCLNDYEGTEHSFRILRTALQVHETAQILQNCAADYIEKIEDKYCLLVAAFHKEEGEKPVALAELWLALPKTWRQASTKANRPLEEPLKQEYEEARRDIELQLRALRGKR